MTGIALGLLMTATGLQAADPATVPTLEEQASAAGLAHEYTGPWEFFVGGGAAALDCNADRKPDLVLAGGQNPAALFVNRSEVGGKLRFESAALGVSDEQSRNVTGVYPIDIDNDGWKDLVLLRVGRNLVLRGGPGCRFEPANRDWAVDGGTAWTTAFSASWEAGARFPTLAFGNYVDRSAPESPWGTCEDNVLLRPRPGATPDYRDVTPLSPGYCALSMLFTDWNDSGEAALRITNDRQYHLTGEEQLWRIPTGGRPEPYGRDQGWRHLKIWGMGIAEADLDADGYPEYALTSMADTKVQRLTSGGKARQPQYEDVAYQLGATAHRPYTGGDVRPSTGWHAEFADFDNDGYLDLFIAKGNVEAMPDFAAFDPDNLLLGGPDGRFVEAGETAGIALNRRGRGAAIADFNLDGALDLLVVNREGPASLFRNLDVASGRDAASQGNWLAVELRQQGANRDAVGARLSFRVAERTLERRVRIGGGHASGHIGWTHVGLGTAAWAQIRIRWPDGRWSRPYRARANNFVVIDRDTETARYWRPADNATGSPPLEPDA